MDEVQALQAGIAEWDRIDPIRQPADLLPSRTKGLHLTENVNLRTRFFNLFLSKDMMDSLVNFTNQYAWQHILSKPSYAQDDGSWQETSTDELGRFLALLLYFGILRLPDVEKYWSTRKLSHGLWARKMLTRLRFRSMRAFFQCFSSADPDDRLQKSVTFTMSSVLNPCSFASPAYRRRSMRE